MINVLAVNSFSEKKLGELSQVIEDHCYARKHRGPSEKHVTVDACVENDTKKSEKSLNPRESCEDVNGTTIVKVICHYIIVACS